MSVSVRSVRHLSVPIYTAHVRCDVCEAEVTASVGGKGGADGAFASALTKATDEGWELGAVVGVRCPAHRTTPRPVRVLLLGTMGTPWRDAAREALAPTGATILSNEDPGWLLASGGELDPLVGNDLVLIERAEVVLWHHGPHGETARIELGLLAGMFPRRDRVVVHVDASVPWREYARALCGQRGLRWAPSFDAALDYTASLAADIPSTR